MNNFYEDLILFYDNEKVEENYLKNRVKNFAYIKDRLIIFKLDFAKKLDMYKFFITYDKSAKYYNFKNYMYFIHNSEFWYKDKYDKNKNKFKNYCLKRMKVTPQMQRLNFVIKSKNFGKTNPNFMTNNKELNRKFTLGYFKNFIEQIFHLKKMNNEYITLYEDKYFKNIWKNKGNGISIFLETETGTIIEWNWTIEIRRNHPIKFFTNNKNIELLFDDGQIFDIGTIYSTWKNTWKKNNELPKEWYKINYKNKSKPLIKCKIIKIKKLDDEKNLLMLNELIYIIDDIHNKLIDPKFKWVWKILDSNGVDAGALTRQSFSIFAKELSENIFQKISDNCDYYNFKKNLYDTDYYKKYEKINFNDNEMIHFVGELFAVTLLRKTNIPISLDPIIYYILIKIFKEMHRNKQENQTFDISKINYKMNKDFINNYILSDTEDLIDLFLNDYLEVYDKDLIGEKCKHYHKLKSLLKMDEITWNSVIKTDTYNNFKDLNNLNIDYNKIRNIPKRISKIPCDEYSVKKWKSRKDNINFKNVEYTKELQNDYCKNKMNIFEIDYEKIGFNDENKLVKINDKIKIQTDSCLYISNKETKIKNKKINKFCSEDNFKTQRTQIINNTIKSNNKLISEKVKIYKINEREKYIKKYIITNILPGNRIDAISKFCTGFIKIIPENLIKYFADLSIRDLDFLITGEKSIDIDDFFKNLEFKFIITKNYNDKQKEQIEKIKTKIIDKLKYKIKENSMKNNKYLNLLNKLFTGSFNKPLSGFETSIKLRFVKIDYETIKNKYGLSQNPDIKKVLELKVDQITNIAACFGQVDLIYDFDIHDLIISNPNNIDNILNNDKSIKELLNQFDIKNIIKFPGVLDDNTPFNVQ
jgi:hypothetical protein